MRAPLAGIHVLKLCKILETLQDQCRRLRKPARPQCWRQYNAQADRAAATMKKRRQISAAAACTRSGAPEERQGRRTVKFLQGNQATCNPAGRCTRQILDALGRGICPKIDPALPPRCSSCKQGPHRLADV